jgi:hypothetical protein
LDCSLKWKISNKTFVSFNRIDFKRVQKLE